MDDEGTDRGDPGEVFDRIVEWAAPAMVVVTAAAPPGPAGGDGRSGCLVGFWSQCGIDPRRVMVWISRTNHTLGVARRASHLAVHHLADGDGTLARWFGELTGDEVDKFEGLDVSAGPGGAPLLEAVRIRWVGRVLDVVDLDADHVGFLLEPVEARAPEGIDGSALRLPDVEDLRPGHPA